MEPIPRRPYPARWLAAAVLLAASAASNAALVVYTTASSFNAAVTSSGLDSFDDLALGAAVPGPVVRTAGAFSYSVTADPSTAFVSAGSPPPVGYIVAAGSVADAWLSTNSTTDTLRFFGLGGARAIGGQFFGSDVNGQLAGGASINLLATDALGTQSYTLTGAHIGSFVGFVSDTALVSLAVQAGQAQGDVWVTANNLQLAAAVPEPQIATLAMVGLGFLGLAIRRRQRLQQS